MPSFMFRSRRKVVSWEVDKCQSVQPTPTWLDGDRDCLDVRDISSHESTVLVRFDLTAEFYNETSQHRRSALIHARKQLLKVVADKRDNMLLSEGWTITTLRNGKAKRLQVQYRGRSAYTSGEVKPRNPPFMDVLES